MGSIGSAAGDAQRSLSVASSASSRAEGLPTGAVLGVARRVGFVFREIATDFPKIAMLQHHDPDHNPIHAHSFADKAKDLLEEVFPGANVIKHDYEPPEIDGERLNFELRMILEGLTQPHRDVPIPQAIIAALSELEGESPKYPELYKMKQIADMIVQQHNAILLPGGASIEPEFYGERLKEGEIASTYHATPQRSILEFCLINACRTQGKPILGICRGHQAINVFFGGSLDRESLGDTQQSVLRYASPKSSMRKSEDAVATGEELGDSTPVISEGVGGSGSLSITSDASPRFLTKIPDRAYFNHKQVVTKKGRGLASVVKLSARRDLQSEIDRLNRNLGTDREVVGKSRENYLGDLAQLLGGMGEEERQQFGAVWDEAKRRVDNFEAAKAELQRRIEFLEKEEVVIAVEAKSGAPMIGTQFHPEKVRDSDEQSRALDKVANQNVMKLFSKMAEISRLKTAMLEEFKSRTTGLIHLEDPPER